jgi:hypothetical protein
MFPAGVATPEGGGNRLYCFFTRGTTSNSPKDGYVMWADADSGYPTGTGDWNGPNDMHPDVAGSTISDSNYPDRPILDIDYTYEDGVYYVWAQYLEMQDDYNPYGVYNVHNVYSDDSFETDRNLERITADAYTKNHQIGDGLDEYMYETYHSYSGSLETGNMDVWLKVYHVGWEIDPDVWGPTTSMVGATPDPVEQGYDIEITANIDDTKSGNSDIAAAEYCIDTESWPGTSMSAYDLSFDSPTESVTATYGTGGLSIGEHTIYVRGQDDDGNWGDSASGTFEVIASPNPPPVVTVLDNNGQGEDGTWSGTETITWTATDDQALPAGCIDIDYSDDSGGSWNPIPGAQGIDNTPSSYDWDTTTVADGTEYLLRVICTDSGSAQGQDDSDAVFTIDNVPDAPVVTVTYPNGGEFFQVGTTETITWTATDGDPGDTITIDIYYCTDYPTATWQQIATGETNDGSWDWTPIPEEYSSTCRVRIVGTDDSPSTLTGEDIRMPILR